MSYKYVSQDRFDAMFAALANPPVGRSWPDSPRVELSVTELAAPFGMSHFARP